MKNMLGLICLLVMSACTVDTQPRRLEFNLQDAVEACNGVCNRHGGVEDMIVKIITGRPTDFTVTCVCVDEYEKSWIDRLN